MTGGRGSSSRPCHLPPPPPAPHQLPVMFFPKKERMRKGIRFSLARCEVIYFYFCKCHHQLRHHHHQRHHHHHSRILVCSPPAQAWPTTPRSWRWKEGQRFSPGSHWQLVTSFNHWHYNINHDWSISTTISIESTTRCSSTLAIMSDASGYLQVTSMPLLDLSS